MKSGKFENRLALVGVLIAGGHVHVLLNRLRLFGLGEGAPHG